MARCVHCRTETEKFTLIEGIGKIAVCDKCMAANDTETENVPTKRELRLPGVRK